MLSANQRHKIRTQLLNKYANLIKLDFSRKSGVLAPCDITIKVLPVAKFESIKGDIIAYYKSKRGWTKTLVDRRSYTSLVNTRRC